VRYALDPLDDFFNHFLDIVLEKKGIIFKNAGRVYKVPLIDGNKEIL